MIDSAFLARLRIEPLDRKRHDRTALRCGVDRIDNFLQKTAARLQDDDHSRVYVACLDDRHEIVGFYALNAYAIEITSLPDALRKGLPSYPAISSIYLSMLGFDAHHQGKGGGTFLMVDAFKRAAAAADIVGAHFLVLDALNERAAALYRALGFVDLQDHPGRMLIGMRVVRRA
jgi:ribosomal protein S18 acetylase RimI-like enzyme